MKLTKWLSELLLKKRRLQETQQQTLRVGKKGRMESCIRHKNFRPCKCKFCKRCGNISCMCNSEKYCDRPISTKEYWRNGTNGFKTVYSIGWEDEALCPGSLGPANHTGARIEFLRPWYQIWRPQLVHFTELKKSLMQEETVSMLKRVAIWELTPDRPRAVFSPMFLDSKEGWKDEKSHKFERSQLIHLTPSLQEGELKLRKN